MREGGYAMKQEKAYYHLPGSFEFYELYREFLPLFRTHREYFYDWCDIGSIYGAPADCVWGGGRAGFGEHDPKEVLALTREYGISARLTFSNSLLREEHLSDKKCNALCALFERENQVQSGVIVHSELLLDYLNSDSGVSILSLVKEMLLHQSALVDSVLAKLFEVFASLEKEDVILSALWVISEFTPSASLPHAIQTVLVRPSSPPHSQDAVGPLPLRQDVEVPSDAAAAPAAAPTVLQDGTYASQSYVASETAAESSVLPLRHLLLEPSFFACSALSNALAKLCISLERSGAPGTQLRDLKLQSLLVMAELLAEYETTMDDLDRERIEFFVRALLDPAVGALLHDQIMRMSREGRRESGYVRRSVREDGGEPRQEGGEGDQRAAASQRRGRSDRVRQVLAGHHDRHRRQRGGRKGDRLALHSFLTAQSSIRK